MILSYLSYIYLGKRNLIDLIPSFLIPKEYKLRYSSKSNVDKRDIFYCIINLKNLTSKTWEDPEKADERFNELKNSLDLLLSVYESKHKKYFNEFFKSLESTEHQCLGYDLNSNTA